ncbi:hypothetical protein AAZV13_10G089800 [Glycine max]
MYNSNSAALDIDDAKSHTQTRLLLSRSRITHLDHPLSLVKTSIWNQFFPILGFFCAGVVLNQFGLIRNLTNVKALSEWGILFLLFEMGLELSLARLKALAKYAFGMGLAQLPSLSRGGSSKLHITTFNLPNSGTKSRCSHCLRHWFTFYW